MTMTEHQLNRWVSAATLVAMISILAACVGCVSVEEQGVREAPPQQATVSFSSYPNGAEVLVDGQFRGTVPVNLHLTEGTHTVELRLEGHRPWKRELVVVAGDDTRVGATLQPE
jgi:hypothetical protein